MCLFTLQDKPFVAEEDIVCYKNMSITEDGRFISPVMCRYIPYAVISGKRLYKARWRLCGKAVRLQIHSLKNINIVDRGWIHTHASEPLSCDCVCFECVIPKGTKYWISVDGSEYASRSIRFVKPCEEQIRRGFAESMGRFPLEDELSVIVGSIDQTNQFFKKFA